MNRRSFLKVLGIGGVGAMATFAMSTSGLSAMQKFSNKADIATAQKVLADIQNYGKSHLVERVPTTQAERAILLGIRHHCDGDRLAMVRVDEYKGHVQGKAYVHIRGYYHEYLPCSFYFQCHDELVSSDFKYMMHITKDVSKNIMAYVQHLQADKEMGALMARQTGVSILPVF